MSAGELDEAEATDTAAISERAAARAREHGLRYAGALAPREAWELAQAGEAELVRVTGRDQEFGRLRPDLWRTLAGPQKDPGRLLGPN